MLPSEHWAIIAYEHAYIGGETGGVPGQVWVGQWVTGFVPEIGMLPSEQRAIIAYEHAYLIGAGDPMAFFDWVLFD